MPTSSELPPTVLMLLTSEIVAATHRALQAAAPEIVITTDAQAADPARVDAILAFKLAAGIAPRFPRLKLVASVGAGADGILAAGDIPAGVAVTRVVDAGLGHGMAQYVAYQVLRHFRRFDRFEAQQPEAAWTRYPMPSAGDHTVGIMGVGELGRAAARVLSDLGFRVVGLNRSGRPAPGVQRMFGQSAELPAFLAEVDTLVCLLPSTAQTKGILGRENLARLRPGAFIVNASRGGVLQESALLELLDENRLAGAALAVFETEPLPREHALWSHPRVSITPHMAAQPSLKGTVQGLVENLRRLRAGEPLLHTVDRSAGY